MGDEKKGNALSRDPSVIAEFTRILRALETIEVMKAEAEVLVMKEVGRGQASCPRPDSHEGPASSGEFCLWCLRARADTAPQELCAKVAMMRELGVVQFDGIVLGPAPTRLETLRRKAETQPDIIDREALAQAEREARIETARDEIRMKLGDLTGKLSNVDLDQYIDPRVFQ